MIIVIRYVLWILVPLSAFSVRLVIAPPAWNDLGRRELVLPLLAVFVPIAYLAAVLDADPESAVGPERLLPFVLGMLAIPFFTGAPLFLGAGQRPLVRFVLAVVGALVMCGLDIVVLMGSANLG